MFKRLRRARDKRFVIKFMDNLIEWSDLNSPDYVLKRYTSRALGWDTHEAEVSVSMEGRMWKFVDSGGRRLSTFPILSVSREKIFVVDIYSKSGARIAYYMPLILFFGRSDNAVRKSFAVRHAIYAINRLLCSLRHEEEVTNE